MSNTMINMVKQADLAGTLGGAALGASAGSVGGGMIGEELMRYLIQQKHPYLSMLLPDLGRFGKPYIDNAQMIGTAAGGMLGALGGGALGNSIQASPQSAVPQVASDVDATKQGAFKAALDQSTLLGGVPVLGPTLAGLSASAQDRSVGSGMGALLGSGAGQALGLPAGAVLGGLAGRGLGHLYDMHNRSWLDKLLGSEDDTYQQVGTALGGGIGALGGLVGGGMLGSAAGHSVAEPHDLKDLRRAQEAEDAQRAADYELLRDALAAGQMGEMHPDLAKHGSVNSYVSDAYERGAKLAFWTLLGRGAPLLKNLASSATLKNMGRGLASTAANVGANMAVDNVAQRMGVENPIIRSTVGMSVGNAAGNAVARALGG